MNIVSNVNIDLSRYSYIQLFTLLSLTSILLINLFRQIIEDIKNNPSRYVNFSLIGGVKKYNPKDK